MSDPTHHDLETLRSLMSDLGPEAEETVGLLLPKSGYFSAYDVTPPGALVFGATGGDGVHFSFLPSENGPSNGWPVVMTVPMQFDRPNLVVGSDLRDFLSIGLNMGYFALEQLVYDEAGMVALLDGARTRKDAPSLMRSTLRAIAVTFSLEPWRDHSERLAWLNNNIPLPVEN